MFVCGLYYEWAESLVFVIFMSLTLKTGGRGTHSETEAWRHAVIFRWNECLSLISCNMSVSSHIYLSLIFASPAEVCLHWRGTIATDMETSIPPVTASHVVFEASQLSALPFPLLGSFIPVFVMSLVCALSKATGSTKEFSSQPLVLGLSEFLLVCMKKEGHRKKTKETKTTFRLPSRRFMLLWICLMSQDAQC